MSEEKVEYDWHGVQRMRRRIAELEAENRRLHELFGEIQSVLLVTSHTNSVQIPVSLGQIVAYMARYEKWQENPGSILETDDGKDQAST